MEIILACVFRNVALELRFEVIKCQIESGLEVRIMSLICGDHSGLRLS